MQRRERNATLLKFQEIQCYNSGFLQKVSGVEVVTRNSSVCASCSLSRRAYQDGKQAGH